MILNPRNQPCFFLLQAGPSAEQHVEGGSTLQAGGNHIHHSFWWLFNNGKGIATSYYMGNIIKTDGNGKDTTLKNQFTEPFYRWKYVTIGFHIMTQMFSTLIQKVFKKIGRISTTFYLAGYLRLAM
jgi:hypothetical protein